MIATGMLTAICFIIIAAKLGPQILKKILGFEVFVDIGSHMFFIWLGALSGTFSGVMTGIISALAISAVLRIAKNVLGYTKYEDGKWIDHDGKWTVRYLTAKIITIVKSGSEDLMNQVRQGVEDFKEEPLQIAVH